MVRPRKCRKVCGLPEINSFGPLDAQRRENMTINMTVEEYETIRLIDLEEKTQQECSERMGVARTTVQGIYDAARKKLADALVNGKHLQIAGGDYELCGEGGFKACRWQQECPKRKMKMFNSAKCKLMQEELKS
ncbi:MAG: DUF134 domain-containing protein [Acholeplasmataceae bacterium]|nr:DUF134 domain-containing protein [Acholeplasmataceae bacterium]